MIKSGICMNFWCMGILLHALTSVLSVCIQLATLSSLLVGVSMQENWALFSLEI